MAKEYDSVTKQLLEEYPLDWLNQLGFPCDSAEVVESDLSTIIAEADKLIRVRSDQPYIAHIEMQASYKPDMAERFLMYNAVAGFKTRSLVRTAVVLLCPEADGRAMRESFRKGFAGEDPYHTFHFHVIRLWEIPVEKFLSGGLGVLPLAPLCAGASDDLPATVRRMESRIKSESADSKTLLTAAYILMGLRYEDAIADSLLRGVMNMEESVTYQAIIRRGEARGRAEGVLEGERSLLLVLGSSFWGQPSEATLAQITAISDAERLKALALKLIKAKSWSELLSSE